MGTAHRISLTAREWDLLKGMVDAVLRASEDDARDGFAYMDDVRHDVQYLGGESLGEYGDPFYDESEEARNRALRFRDRCEFYYRLFHEDWLGQDGSYTQDGKWERQYSWPPPSD